MIATAAYACWQAPRLPGFAGQLVDEITALGIHQDLALAGVVGSASLLTQGVADVEWLGGVVETIGANVFAVSPSGSGKTLMLKLLMEPLHQFLNEDPQQKFQPLTENVTRQVLPSQLADCRFAWLSTDEAGQIMPLLEGGAPWLAKMLDARPLQRARVATGTVRLVGYRLSALLLAQPIVFNQLCPMIRGAVVIGLTKGRFDKALAEIGSIVSIQIAKGRRGDILKIRQPHWPISLAAAARVNQI